MTNNRAGKKGILARLRRDETGNTLALVAASLVPVLAVVGGAIDTSRIYLAQTRLSQACDAGALAGRKMLGNGTVVTTAVSDEIAKYVNFNFPQGYMGSSTYTISPTTDSNGQLSLGMTTNVPMTVMGIFGYDSKPVTVNCRAKTDYANIDIVLVLDVTGSMACKPERDASSCTTYANGSGISQTKTVNGRTVTYLKEETGTVNGVNGVNISRMQGLRDALASLQTTVASIETEFNTETDTAKRKRVRWAIIPFSQMVNAGFSTGTAGTTLYSRQNAWFNSSARYYSGSSESTTTHNASWISNTWDGCVEERGTSNTITATSGHSISPTKVLPTTAYDLDIDTAPTSTAATKWTMADDAATGSSQYACPKAMRELQTMSATTFNDYFTANNGFLANGGTYLDIGMLWAARLLSRNGMWSADNPLAYNSFPISRFVIFMTDGVMDTGNAGYGAYGQERYWKRVASDGSVAKSNANHSQRLAMICTAIKNMDTKIFSVSFGAGSALSGDLTGCASGSDYAFAATSSTALQSTFSRIADAIGSLRLTQ